MSRATDRPPRRVSPRWAAPLGIAALAIGGTLAGPAIAASAGVDLPDRTAEQLLTDLQGADVTALSGTVVVDAKLGLPSLDVGSGMGGPPGGSGTDLLSVLGGETTVRVWASADKARIAVLGDVGERAMISDGTQVWTWSSDDRSVTHTVLPTKDDLAARAPDDATTPTWPEPDAALTPEGLSAMVLENLTPTTSVTTGANVRVAGRPAYQLVLAPAEPGSLVAEIRIAIDAAERVPTRVEILSTTSATPAMSVGFTSVSFSAPDPAVFDFTPPAGASVTEKAWDEPGHGMLSDGAANGDGTGGTSPTTAEPPTVVGTGWASVLVAAGVPVDALTAPTEAGGAEPGTDLASMLALLPEVSGSWGSGHLLTSALFSALLTDDGHLLVGAVDGDTLQRVAATLG